MNENLGKKLTLTVVMCIAALACLLLPSKPFRLGLDLQGGTRLTYRFDFVEALRQGKISQAELNDKTQLLLDLAAIIKGRVDPTGVKELHIFPEGQDRIVIELPGAAELANTDVRLKLATPLDAAALTLTLENGEIEALKSFPLTGGDVLIDNEKLRYSSRSGTTLVITARSIDGTSAAAHAAGASVELKTTDDLQKAIENVGDMQFFLGAKPDDVIKLGSDLQKEHTKAVDWIKANPGRSIDVFNRLKTDQGGPAGDGRLYWYPDRIKHQEAETPLETRLVPLLKPDNPLWSFGGGDLESVGVGSDGSGYPAVQFEISAEKRSAFTDFTQTHIGDQMAIVMNNEVVTNPTINSKLPGGGIITGGARGFLLKEVKDLVSVLRSGSLRVKPELMNKARVGATLGEDYLSKSYISGIVALAVIVFFMVFFYHRLGVFSVIGLLVNLLLLMGAMAFLKATLTLPGVSGVILTLGMAVDGNILIYERLREELARGLKTAQAVKAAFARANVTIIDSHVTQLIAGVILYFVGTGPIRGFATTLNIGILSTLFTVIVLTELLVLLDLKRGQISYTMKHVFVNPGWPFMKWSKPAISLSLVVIIAGVGLFAMLPEQEKLGIDFLGGFTMTVRTEEPQTATKIRELVQSVPGTIGKSAAVTELLDSGSTAKGFKAFRITYKLAGEANPNASTGETGLKEVQQALASVLEKGPIEVALTEGKASGKLHFEDPHPAADMSAKLGEAGLKEVKVETVDEKSHVYSFAAAVDAGVTREGLEALIRNRFQAVKDSLEKPYNLSSSVPESSFIGPQAGNELRDKAVLAVLLSLLGTIFYLRIRFAEYSYGVAVVVSLLHDVLIALGALALACKTGLVQGEVDLSMIAAFLTIIGYSQNDTIVIFDRVRENRPKSNKPLAQILDDSINECFGRTILTTATVVLTLLVLFLFNIGTRNVLEGFSYCMLVGVISGAYSTIYVASPVLLWLENRSAARHDKQGESGLVVAGTKRSSAGVDKENATA